MLTLGSKVQSPLFNLFGKKSSSSATDLVWIHRKAKDNGLLSILKEHPDTVLVAWFEETQDVYTSFLQENGISTPVYLYRQIHAAQVGEQDLVMLEHYPLAEKENEFWSSFSAKKIRVLSALDEPLFKQFGGDKVVDMMKKLGMDENESISHALISSAIKNAQEKIAKKIGIEQPARSATEWLERNFPH